MNARKACQDSKDNVGGTLRGSGAVEIAQTRPQSLQARNGRANNPFMGCWARWYDYVVAVPPVKYIRRTEEETLRLLYDQTIRPTDTILEIGPGTGRSTAALCARASRVVAVEQSPAMFGALQARLAEAGIDNCEAYLGDFSSMNFDEDFDVVALIGVLDYVADPCGFLQRAAALARRAVLFTIPQQGFLSTMFSLCSSLRRIRIFPSTIDQVNEYLPDFRVEVFETGFKTRLWRGMTLACRAVRL